jgi:hypothetical protein
VASSYPGGLDTFPTVQGGQSGDKLNDPKHSTLHNDADAAIVAIETELGTDPAGSATDVAGRLDGIDSSVGGKADSASLAGVATSGAYSDLSGTPSIPSDAADVGAVDYTGPTLVKHIWSGTQSQYDAITSPDENTLYVVKDNS